MRAASVTLCHHARQTGIFVTNTKRLLLPLSRCVLVTGREYRKSFQLASDAGISGAGLDDATHDMVRFERRACRQVPVSSNEKPIPGPRLLRIVRPTYRVFKRSNLAFANAGPAGPWTQEWWGSWTNASCHFLNPTPPVPSQVEPCRRKKPLKPHDPRSAAMQGLGTVFSGRFPTSPTSYDPGCIERCTRDPAPARLSRPMLRGVPVAPDLAESLSRICTHSPRHPHLYKGPGRPTISASEILLPVQICQEQTPGQPNVFVPWPRSWPRAYAVVTLLWSCDSLLRESKWGCC